MVAATILEDGQAVLVAMLAAAKGIEPAVLINVGR